MNKQQYDDLDKEQKAIATEAYIDGFLACIEQVKSIMVRVGDQDVDKTFRVNRDMIAENLQHAYEKLLLQKLL
jgi:hypothetical protein